MMIMFTLHVPDGSLTAKESEMMWLTCIEPDDLLFFINLVIHACLCLIKCTHRSGSDVQI